MINIADQITLSDQNTYVVVSKVNFENKIYYYLIDMNRNDNIKFCYEDGEELTELNDKKLVTRLLPLFIEEANKFVS